MDFDRRAEDKTTSNILILGNSGQGKSYLLKLILTNIRESGKRVICLDPESEYEDLRQALVIRLKTLKLLIPHDLTEYLEKGLQLGGAQ